MRVLSLQTPLLGHRTYGNLLRSFLRSTEALEFDAHWSTQAHDDRARGAVERQLDRLFLKMFRHPVVRSRNLDFFPLRYEIGTSYWARRTLSPLLRSRPPDVLHLHTQAISFLSLDVMARIPTVVSVDGTARQMAAQVLARPWHWTFAGNVLLERLAFGRAAAIVAFSTWAADAVVREYAIDPSRVHVIPPGVDLARFGPRDASARDASAPLRVLFVGGEFDRKGGPDLVRAFLQRFAGDERVRLDVVTRSPFVSAHPRIVAHAAVEAYSEAWHALYRDADVFVLPTRRDQSPNVFLEAMAAGLPVIATPVGSAAETIVDGTTGFIVPAGDVSALGDRIATLLKDPDLRRRFGAAGRALVEARYDAERNARELAAVFASVAKRTRRG